MYLLSQLPYTRTHIEDRGIGRRGYFMSPVRLHVNEHLAMFTVASKNQSIARYPTPKADKDSSDGQMLDVKSALDV